MTTEIVFVTLVILGFLTFMSIIKVDALANIDEFKIAGESLHMLKLVLKKGTC